MEYEAARQIILLHASLDGFLGSLRPYRGQLDPRMFDELMEAVAVVGPRLREAVSLDPQIVGALWNIQYFVWLWALAPGGMIRRNGLMDDAALETLDSWLEAFGWAVHMFLEGGPDDEALSLWRQLGDR